MQKNHFLTILLLGTATSTLPIIKTYDSVATFYDTNTGYSYAVPCRNELDSRNHVRDLFANMKHKSISEDLFDLQDNDYISLEVDELS
jgi:hypothetical protein